MKTEISALLELIKGFSLFSLLFFVARVFFFFYFDGAKYLDQNAADVFYAFYMGLRYDLIVISYLFILPLLGFLVTNLVFSKWTYRIYLISIKFIFIAGGIFIPILIICDYGFYSIYQDHINIIFFGLFEDDTAAILESIWKDYPVILMAMGFILYVSALVYFSSKFFKFPARVKSSSFSKKIVMTLVTLLIFTGTIRGGYGALVLSPKFADFSEIEFINHVAQNGIISLEETYKLRQSRSAMSFNMADELGYRKRIQDAFSDYIGIDLSLTPRKDLLKLLRRTTPKNKKLDENKPNVIVILMESLASFWLQFHSKEFNLLGEFEKHTKEDIFFPYFLPSDNGTIGSLMALSTNIPHRRGARFISESRYMYLPLESAAHVPYKKRGYRTSFYYGGKLSWRGIGKYFHTQGYDSVEGENTIKKQIKDQSKYGNEWGLFDQYLFDHIYAQLEKDGPQFIMALSTSNHPPYEVPASYQELPLKAPIALQARVSREHDLFEERFKAFQYANQILGKFISRVKENYPNTIIAVTGDHNFLSFLTYEKEESFMKHMVPTYFYIPKDIWNEEVDTTRIGSHDDIMTTLYNHSLSETEYLSFGEDLFSTPDPVGINSVVLANKAGIHYKGKYYNWSQYPKINPKPVEKNKTLDKNYRSTVSVADFFLRFTLEQASAALKKSPQE